MACTAIDISKYEKEIVENDDLTIKQKDKMINILITNEKYNILCCIVSNNIIFLIKKLTRTIEFHTHIVFDEYLIIKTHISYSKYSIFSFYRHYSGDVVDEEMFYFANDELVIRIYKSINELIEKLLIGYNNNDQNVLSLFTDDGGICRNKFIAKTMEQNIINKLNEIIVDEENQYIILEIFKKYKICTDLNIDNVLQNIFGFIPRTNNFTFSFID